jgi:phosphohistidine swiveling domain-containing protein
VESVRRRGSSRTCPASHRPRRSRAPCDTVKGVLGDLAEERDDFTWVYADAAEHLPIAEEHRVLRVPTLFVVARDGQEALSKIKQGAILVTPNTDSDMMRAFEQASAVITEEGGLTSHAAIVDLSLGIPVIVDVEGATHTFTDGKHVTVDAVRGHIYSGHAKIL